MASGQDVEVNLKAADGFIREAAAQGANLIQTPEMTDQILSKDADRNAAASPMDDHRSAQFFRNNNELFINKIDGFPGSSGTTGDVIFHISFTQRIY